MNKYFLSCAVCAAFLFGCSDSKSPTAADPVKVKVDQAIVDQPAVPVTATTVEALANGDTVDVAFGASTAQVSVLKNSSNEPIVAVTSSDGTITYFEKSADQTAALSKVAIAGGESLQEMLKGVWVAIAQLKGGVYFKLVVDPNNQLTLLIEKKETGVQIDIQIQGTPSQEQVEAAAVQFFTWIANPTESSSALITSSATLGSSSAVTEIPMSSTPQLGSSSVPSIVYPISSSSYGSEIPLSSSIGNVDGPLSSSSGVILPVSSSSSVVASSSSSDPCFFDEWKTALTTQKAWNEANGFSYSKTSCMEGIVTRHTPSYATYQIKTNWIEHLGYYTSTSIQKIVIDGGALSGTKCTRALSWEDTSVWPMTDATASETTTFSQCLDSMIGGALPLAKKAQ